MSQSQWRVFGILMAVLGLQVLFSPRTRSVLGTLGQTSAQGPSAVKEAVGGVDMALFFLWALGAAALLLLADVAGEVATWVAILLLTGVVLAHGTTISAWITDTVGFIQSTQTPAGGGTDKRTPPSK